MSPVEINGETEIPQHKWYELVDKMSRVDDLLEILNKQVDVSNRLLTKMLEVLEGFTIPEFPPPTTPPTNGGEVTVIVERELRNKYAIVDVDLSIANNDKEIKLPAVVTSATIVKCDAPVSWKRNSVSNPSEDLSLSYSVDDFTIDKFYITNAAAAAGSKLRILVEWKE